MPRDHGHPFQRLYVFALFSGAGFSPQQRSARYRAIQAGLLNLFCDPNRHMHALLRTTFRQRRTQVSRLAGRCASTARSSTNPYPYPSNSSPTPHQIFHLPLSASQEEVKSRCVHRLTDHSAVLQR